MAQTNLKSISRMEFLRGFFSYFKEEYTSEQITSCQNYLIPPGAENRESYMESCTQCYDCIAVCPHEALRVLHKTDDKLDGYPVIQPEESPCYRCEDYPCIEACSPGALQLSRKNNALGQFQINEDVCLAYSKHLCFSCFNSCPESGVALVLDKVGRPTILEEHCTGCGICINMCPGKKESITIKL